jgi:hypothetical protein
MGYVKEFFLISFYLQSVLVCSAKTVACIRALSSTPLLQIGSRPVVTFGNMLKNDMTLWSSLFHSCFLLKCRM